ncbi:MAG: MFS transporter [Firmicutes bacterium]|nr:MFS transporter [Bacillota bacterium]
MKLSLKTKLSYGSAAICDNAMYTLTGTYLLLYLTTVAGVSPAIAGTISAIGSVWEALCAPIVGYKSDHMKSRFGRRKPFLLMASFPAAIITSLLFTTFDASPAFKTAYYIIMVILFWTCFSSEFVPYMAWGSDLTEDYNERTVLRSFSYVFNQVGMGIGMVMPTIIVDYCMGLGKTLQQSWQLVGIFVGVCCCCALLIGAWNVKDTDVKDFVKPAEKEPFLDFGIIKGIFCQYFDILKLRPIQYIIGASLMYLVANVIFGSDRVFFMTYNLGMPESTISLMLLVITVNGILMVPFITKLAAKFDKKTVFMCGIGGAGLLMILMRILGISNIPSLLATVIFYGIANACYWQLMPSMLYDVCAAEELVSGENRSGAVISLQALSESLSIAASAQMLGIILELAGFDGNAAQQIPLALEWIANCFTVVPGIFMILAALLIFKYPINKHNFGRVMDALDRKNAGMDVDLTQFNDIFMTHK